MTANFKLLVLLMIVSLSVQYGFAQETVTTPNSSGSACSSSLWDIQNATASYIDFNPACEALTACVNSPSSGYNCLFQIADPLLASCENDDLRCRNQTLFATTLIWSHFSRPIPVNDAFLKMLEGKDAEALALLPTINTNDEFLIGSWDTLRVLYCRGLLLELLGRPQEALNDYSKVIAYTYGYFPLANYSRGLLYAELGETAKASFDMLWVASNLNTSPPLNTLRRVTSTYPLDTSRVSEWLRYPVLSHVISPGGDRYTDKTQEKPISVQVAFYDEFDLMLVIGLKSLYENESIKILPSVNQLLATEKGFELKMKFLEGGDEGFSLIKVGETFWGKEFANSGESQPIETFILAPAHQPDPRISLGQPQCEGGVISRLHRGMTVNDGSYQPVFVYSKQLGGELDSAFDSYPITLVSEPICIGNQLWWQIADINGTIGWHTENEDNLYRINPNDTQLQEFLYCPNVRTTRLFVGIQASVVAGFGANYLRDAASLSANILTSMPEGALVQVVGKAVCADDYVWWQVVYNNQTGWTVEGDANNYWLAPVS